MNTCPKCGGAWSTTGVVRLEFWAPPHPEPLTAGPSQPIHPCRTCRTPTDIARDISRPIWPMLSRYAWKFVHIVRTDGEISDRIERAAIEGAA